MMAACSLELHLPIQAKEEKTGKDGVVRTQNVDGDKMLIPRLLLPLRSGNDEQPKILGRRNILFLHHKGGGAGLAHTVKA